MGIQNRIISMDFIRGISSLLVLFGHLRAALFIDYSQIKNPTIVDKAFYFVSGLGHESVMVFFVLSGFFVGGGILKKRDNFKFVKYLTARLSRLWVVLVPALFFTVLIDNLIGVYLIEVINGGYHDILSSGPNKEYSLSVITFFSNLFFTQTIFTPVFGSNGPLWSLANEFWYYIMFPFLIIVIGYLPKKMLVRFVVGGLLLGIIITTKDVLFEGFLIWLMGVLVYIVYDKKRLNFGIWFTVLSFLFFIISLVNSKYNLIGEDFLLSSDFLIGISFSLVLISLRSLNSKINSSNYFRRFSIWLSDISYTLYIFHFPVILLIYTICYSEKQLSLNMLSLIEFGSWAFLIVLISRVLWWLFERNTSTVRNLLDRVINKIFF